MDPALTSAGDNSAAIRVESLTMAYGDTVIQRDLTFTVPQGAIFIIMGGSGCGKSTLLRHLVGLQQPKSGHIHYGDLNFWEADEAVRKRFLRRCGILYQSGALWSSLTLVENIALPLQEYTHRKGSEIRDLAEFKLALVGLAGFGNHYPAEISGGMRKRAGLARALALDPEILFFDEPSAGLDPLSAKRLDDLILELRDSLGATLVVVTHELSSIFAIGTDAIFLDTEERTLIAHGDPKRLREESHDPRVRRFLTRGAED